jgi:hypothetical protein
MRVLIKIVTHPDVKACVNIQEQAALRKKGRAMCKIAIYPSPYQEHEFTLWGHKKLCSIKIKATYKKKTF